MTCRVTRWIAFAAGLILLCATAAGQRGTCTGTVSDAAGVPLAAARVVFVQQGMQAFGCMPDRVELSTRPDGTFAADLLSGSAYVVWAIGPPDGEGRRLVTTAATAAAAGRELRLVAHLRRAPRRIELRGVTPWVGDRPPALRILVDCRYPLDADLALPGDGTLMLGPWPDADVMLALVADVGGVIDVSALVEADTGVVEFAPMREIGIDVVDGNGASVVGATVHAQSTGVQWWIDGRDPMPAEWRVPWRMVGRTGPDGTAVVRLPWREPADDRNVNLLVEQPGHATALVGVIGNECHVDGTPAPLATPWSVVLRAAAPVELEPQGLREGERAAIQLLQLHVFQTGQVGGVGCFDVPSKPGDAGVTAQLLAKGRLVQAAFRLASSAPVPPRRLVCADLGQPGVIRALDLQEMATHRLRFVDAAGAPLPCVDVAIGLPGRGVLRRWRDRCVTDAEGRLELVADTAAWLILAASGSRFAVQALPADAAGGERTITLVDAPLCRVRVLDADGAPVCGARVDLTGPRQLTISGQSPELAAPCHGFAWALVAAARSEVTGLMEIPLPFGGGSEVRLLDGLGRKASLALAAGDAVVDVVVR